MEKNTWRIKRKNMTFKQKLDKIIDKNNSLLCVGLDSDYEKIPKFLHKKKYPVFEFNKKIIDATHDLVCAYKPNSAFYEARGACGIIELKLTCDYLHKKYPGILIILDAKRADIGNTNNGYVSYAFNYLQADGLTVNPYLGRETIQPFLDKKEKGIIILCKTSNKGSGEFQDLVINKKPLYKIIAEKVTSEWNVNDNCLMVVGATYPQELKEIRKIVGEMTFLVPGIGSQGGDLDKTVCAGINSKKRGMIINSSRGIIFASSDKDFAKHARIKAKETRNLINRYRI